MSAPETRTTFVDELEVGDTIPSHDGYVHTVKRIEYDGADTITVEFWKGPHKTYTNSYSTSDTIEVEL